MTTSSSTQQLQKTQPFSEYTYATQIASLEAQLTAVRSNMGMLIGQMQVCLDNQQLIQMKVDAMDREINLLRSKSSISGMVGSNDPNMPSSVYRTPTGPNEPLLFWSNSSPGGIQTPITALPTGLEDRNNQMLNPMNPLSLAQQQQQQNTSFQMTSRQREEAIMAMINSNALPGDTPTALAPVFPSCSPETMMLQNGMQPMTSVLPQRLSMNSSVPQFDPASGASSLRPLAAMNLQPQGGGFGAPSNVLAPPSQPVLSYIIDPSKATNEHLDHACTETGIKELCLKGCKTITNFTPLSRLRTLWKLNLQGCTPYVDDKVIKLIATYNRRLSRINLCGCDRVTDATPLAQLLFLFDLNLSGCSVGNDSLKAISEGCSQLSRLAINSCPNITEISCLGNLKELKLLYCRYSDNIDPTGISSMLNALGHSLLTLNLDGIKYNSLDIRLTTPSAIKNLNLKDNTELFSLEWMLNNPNMFPAVETLDVEGCTNLRDISNIAKLPHLKTLRLGYTAVDDVALSDLAAGAPSLSALFLEACPNITDFTPLINHKSLTKISVDPTQFSARSTNGLDPLLNGRIEVAVPTGPRRGEGSTQLSAGSTFP